MLSDVCLFDVCFWEQIVGVKVIYWVALRMQKIAADRVNIMECDPESTSVTINFFPKSNSVHYYAPVHGTLRKICGLEAFIQNYLPKSVQENIVILNFTIFCVRTNVFGSIKFCCLIITPLWVKQQYFFSAVLQQAKKILTIFKKYLMKVIHKFSEFWPPFLGNKGKTKLAQSQNMCTTLIQTLLRKVEQICEIFLF